MQLLQEGPSPPKHTSCGNWSTFLTYWVRALQIAQPTVTKQSKQQKNVKGNNVGISQTSAHYLLFQCSSLLQRQLYLLSPYARQGLNFSQHSHSSHDLLLHSVSGIILYTMLCYSYVTNNHLTNTNAKFPLSPPHRTL